MLSWPGDRILDLRAFSYRNVSSGNTHLSIGRTAGRSPTVSTMMRLWQFVGLGLLVSGSALAAKFTIEGYPTLILLDSKGNEVARRVGYQPGGPEAFIKWVESTAKK